MVKWGDLLGVSLQLQQNSRLSLGRLLRKKYRFASEGAYFIQWLRKNPLAPYYVGPDEAFEIAGKTPLISAGRDFIFSVPN
jgi:hypothetical protein